MSEPRPPAHRPSTPPAKRRSPEPFPTARDDRGITLVEILVVVTIIGIIASALAGSVILVTRIQDQAPRTLEESSGAQGLGTFLQADVQSAQQVDTSPGTPLAACTGTTNPTSSNLVLLTWSEPSPGSGQSYAVAYRYEAGGSGEWYVVRHACVDGGPVSSVPVSGNLAPPQAGWAPGQAPDAALVTTIGAGNPADGYTLELTTVSGYAYSVSATRVNRPGALCDLVAGPASMQVTTGSAYTLSGPAAATLSAAAPVVTVTVDVTGPACGSLRLNYDTGVGGPKAVAMAVTGTGPFTATATIPPAEVWLPGQATLTVSVGAAPLDGASQSITVVGCQLNVTALPSPVGLYNTLTTRDVVVTATPVDAALCSFPLEVEYTPTLAGPLEVLPLAPATPGPGPFTAVVPSYSAFDLGTAQFSVYQAGSPDARRFTAIVTIDDNPPPCAFTLSAPGTIVLDPGNLMPAGQVVTVLAEATCETPQIRYDQAGSLTPLANMNGTRGAYSFVLPANELWTPGLKAIEILSGTAATAPNGPSLANLPGWTTTIDVQAPPPACLGGFTVIPGPVDLLAGNTMPAGQVVVAQADAPCGTPRLRYQQGTPPAFALPLAMSPTGNPGEWSVELPPGAVWEPGVKALELLPQSGATPVATTLVTVNPGPTCQVLLVQFQQKGPDNSPNTFVDVGTVRLLNNGRFDGDARVVVTVNDPALCGAAAFAMTWDLAPSLWTGTAISPVGATYTYTLGPNRTNGRTWTPGSRTYSFSPAPQTGSVTAG